jgi:SAM-dependent methyltransferase
MSNDLRHLREFFAQLAAAGLDAANVLRWFGVPRLTDARWAPAPPPTERPRRGLGGWIALWVAGEAVALDDLRPRLDAAVRAALLAHGLAEEDGARLRPRARVLPWRGLWVASPPDEAFDVSALNVAASLPPARTVWDVGCGAGLLSLAAARAGATVLGSDVHEELVGWARLNTVLNGVDARFVAADLLAAAPAGERFEAVLFNAPLLRAPLAAAGDEPRYVAAAGGEALALRFLDGVERFVAPGGRVLLHAQRTAGVAAALAAWAERARVVSVVFAHAPDGTPHALSEIDLGAAPGLRQATVPLSAACAHLSREILDQLGAARALADDATPLPAPWLELRTSERFDGGQRRRLDVRFGGTAVDEADVALLARLRGGTLGELGLTSEERERLDELVARSVVIVT